MPATSVSGVDLYVKDATGHWRFVGNGRPNGLSNAASFATTVGSEFLLYLPLYNCTQIVEFGVAKGRTVSALPASLRRSHKPIVWYGTSIVQGGCASRPGMAATAIVGRLLDSEVINLGFSGSGQMEPQMAALLAELDPSVYVLDCLWNMSPEMVAERVEPFVKKLRETHPDTPILLAEDSNVLDVCPTDKGRILRGCAEKIAAAGLKNVHLLPSRGMLGDDSEGTVDGCHPNDLGMLRQAQVFARAMAPLLKGARP